MESDELDGAGLLAAQLDLGWLRWLPWPCLNVMSATMTRDDWSRENHWGPIDFDAESTDEADLFGDTEEEIETYRMREDRLWALLCEAAGRDRPADYEGAAELLDQIGLLRRRPDGGRRLAGWYVPRILPLPGEVLALSSAEIALEDETRFDQTLEHASATLDDVLEPRGWECTVSMDSLAADSGLDPNTVRLALGLTTWEPADPAIQYGRVATDDRFRIVAHLHEDVFVLPPLPPGTTINTLTERYACSPGVVRRSLARIQRPQFGLAVVPALEACTDTTEITIEFQTDDPPPLG
jgi:hypothetical protein